MDSPRYTHIKALLPVIQVMRKQGMSQRRIAKFYGFRDKSSPNTFILNTTMIKRKLTDQSKSGTVD